VGLDADSGLSGRKLVIDAYGPNVPIGGGSFSGKDYTKVDRSGAYMARKVAIDLLKERQAKTVLVKLAYAIGLAEPVMAVALINGQEENLLLTDCYDFSPGGIRKALDLDHIKFSDLAVWGHFGRRFDF
jgi:S-adenosylmethionine synthetase